MKFLLLLSLIYNRYNVIMESYRYLFKLDLPPDVIEFIWKYLITSKEKIRYAKCIHKAVLAYVNDAFYENTTITRARTNGYFDDLGEHWLFRLPDCNKINPSGTYADACQLQAINCSICGNYILNRWILTQGPKSRQNLSCLCNNSSSQITNKDNFIFVILTNIKHFIFVILTNIKHFIFVSLITINNLIQVIYKL